MQEAKHSMRLLLQLPSCFDCREFTPGCANLPVVQAIEHERLIARLWGYCSSVGGVASDAGK
jgi:hypothetical protein